MTVAKKAPQIRLATVYGQVIDPGRAAPQAPADGQKLDYIPFEAASRIEGPVGFFDVVIWDGRQEPTIWLAPYAEVKVSQIERERVVFNTREHIITCEGRHLLDWTFRDTFKKHRVKSIQEWNPALHNPLPGGQFCITRIIREAV